VSLGTPIEDVKLESRRRPVKDLAMTLQLLSRSSNSKAHLPSYVQVEARSEARLLPPPAASHGMHGGES